MPPKKKTDDEDLTAYYFKWDGKELCLQDIDLDVFDEIETETGVGYVTLIFNPFKAKSGAQKMLAQKCAELLGVELPTPLGPRLMFKMWDLGPDVVPDLYHNGVAVPKASESETATT